MIYWIAQFLGAVVAAAILRGLFPSILGAVPHAPSISDGKALVIEITSSCRG